jgi:hypothetical protein
VHRNGSNFRELNRRYQNDPEDRSIFSIQPTSNRSRHVLEFTDHACKNNKENQTSGGPRVVCVDKSHELNFGIADQTESRLDPVEPRGLGSESDRGHNPFLNRRESNRRESCSHDRLHSTRVPSQEGHAMTLPCLSAW